MSEIGKEKKGFRPWSSSGLKPLSQLKAHRGAVGAVAFRSKSSVDPLGLLTYNQHLDLDWGNPEALSTVDIPAAAA